MRKRPPVVGLGVFVGLALLGPARAADFSLDVTADGIRLNEAVLGTKPAADDLKGRVVLLEFWGIN